MLVAVYSCATILANSPRRCAAFHWLMLIVWTNRKQDCAVRHDPSVINAYITAARYAEGVSKLAWWKYTAKCKHAMAAFAQANR